MAYTVVARHRRQHLATRAVSGITSYAYDPLGMTRVLLRIPAANTASAAVARASGFHVTDAAPITREGARDSLLTWQHHPDHATTT